MGNVTFIGACDIELVLTAGLGGTTQIILIGGAQRNSLPFILLSFAAALLVIFGGGKTGKPRMRTLSAEKKIPCIKSDNRSFLQSA